MTKLYTGRMDPVIKAKWVAALRSGEYNQDDGELRSRDGFCCLGVLCDLHSRETGTEWGTDTLGNPTYGGRRGHPPWFVDEWAKFATIRVQIGGKTQDLDYHNDNGRTFLEIAQAIEDQL